MLLRLQRQGTDNVVRLYPFLYDQRQTHGLNNIVQGLDLIPQIIRHGWTVGLVFAVDLIAETAARGIKHHGNIFRLVFIHQPPQHIQHPNNGAGGLTPRVGQGRQGVVGTKQIGGAIHQDEGVIYCH